MRANRIEQFWREIERELDRFSDCQISKIQLTVQPVDRYALSSIKLFLEGHGLAVLPELKLRRGQLSSLLRSDEPSPPDQSPAERSERWHDRRTIPFDFQETNIGRVLENTRPRHSRDFIFAKCKYYSCPV
jgi:hypothetical protein